MESDQAEIIELEPVKVDEHARDNTDQMRRMFWTYLAISAVGCPIVLAFAAWQRPKQFTPDVIAWTVGMFAFFCVLMPGLLWWHAAGQRRYFASRTKATWEFSARGSASSWHIEGFGTCAGWRIIWVRCEKLPRRAGKCLAHPELRVVIETTTKVLKSREISDTDEYPTVRVVDKVGDQVRIFLSHIRPEDLSEDSPWTVEIGVQGDPNPGPTLRAWIVDGHSADEKATNDRPADRDER